jgi:hypothetical protein
MDYELELRRGTNTDRLVAYNLLWNRQTLDECQLNCISYWDIARGKNWDGSFVKYISGRK